MIRWIIGAALRQRFAVIALAAIVLALGFLRVRQTPFDVFPEFAPVLVEVQTEAPGLSTEEVESLITVPIESAMNGISRLETIRSQSVLGLSQVVLHFEHGTGLWQARQVVQEQLGTVAGRLPQVAEPPVMLPPLSATSRVLKIGLTSPTLSQTELTTLALWTIRPRLMAVSGVANVAIWGQRDRQIQALVDPDRLRAHAVALQQVVEAARGALFVGAGGFVDTPNQRLAVMQLRSIVSPEDLALVPVTFHNGAPTLLGDVAEVVEGHPAPIGDAVVNDGPGLLLIVEKQPWGNTLDVTREVEAALEALRTGLGDVEIDSTIFRPATFIQMALRNLNAALLAGCLLVTLVLFVFLHDWRTALISLVAIPLSLIAGALVLYYQTGTMNTMVLAGLIIALGQVIDDAIIGVENIMRRLRLNAGSAEPRPAFHVVLEASLEVRSAIVNGSLIVALVFVPVFFMGGLAGSFFRPLALAYICAILASMLVALTVAPALSLVLLPRAARARSQVSPVVQYIQLQYRRILPRMVARSRLAAPVMAVVVALAAAVYPLLGEEFLPDFKEYDFLMHWVEKPGTSLEAMQRITVRASKELRAIPGVRNFGAHIGRAEVADEIVGPNFTELWISLAPSVDYEASVGRIQEVVEGYPGLYRDVLTYLKERIKEVLTGASATMVVRIYGPELIGLRRHAEAAGAVIGEVEGVIDLHVEPQVQVPQVVVSVRADTAARFGLTPGAVRRAVTTLVGGTKVGELYEGQTAFDVVVWGVEAVRDDVLRLARAGIDTATGAQVPLADVADVYVASTPNVIKREAGSRRIDVTCNIRGDLGRVAREVERKVRGMAFERGYHPDFLGEYAERQRSWRRLLALSLLSVFAMVVMLHADFGSLRLTALILLGLPFALVGGVLALVASGGVVSLGSLVGFVTVLGIAGRNSIMLVSHYRHLQREEGLTFGDELVLRGAEERVTPILMTALTTVLALLPIVVGGNRPGQEIEHPMALVIVGGLITSTVLTLFLVPALYARFGR